MEHSSTVIDTEYGMFEFHCFNWGSHEDENVLCLRVPAETSGFVNVRLQSACFTAEIFRSKDCDCHEQLTESLALIQAEGGILVYLLQDGRGAGIFKKVQGLELGRVDGLDTADAYERLGISPDPRTYEKAAFALQYFGTEKVRLLTNNPRKLASLASQGFEVERKPLEIAATTESRPYLMTKKRKLGHLLTLSDFE